MQPLRFPTFLVALLAVPLAASADDFHWNSGAVVASDRIFRGQRQTNGELAVSGEMKLSHASGAYTGVWAGNLDLGPGTGTSAEIDWFVGWSKRYGQWNVNTGYLYRQRPSGTLALDFQEATTSVGYDFGRVRAGASVAYSWDYFQGGTSTYTAANVGVPLTTVHEFKLIATAAAGHYDFSNRVVGDYNDMDLRLIAVHDRWQFSVGYSDTDVRAAHSGLLTRDRAGPRARAQVLVMF